MIMSLRATLARYLVRSYIGNFLGFLAALLMVLYLFDTVELIRRASKQDLIPLSLVMKMGLLKLPEVGQILLPFAILFSAIFTFWKLSHRHELVIVRAAGISAWQFLAPVVAVAALLGFLQMSIINPASALFINKFEQLESTYLKGHGNQIAIFKEGLWLRQPVENGYAILRAGKIEQPAWDFGSVTAFFFDERDAFVKRVDSQKVSLREGSWFFEKPFLTDRNHNGLQKESFSLPTDLTRKDIEESFASPESLSFWRLPGQIKIFEETGFDATRLKMQYQSLLSRPLLFPAMVLLAAMVSLRPPRNRGGVKLVLIGVFLGFFVFFMSSFLHALGASGQIPVFLAAWSPALITSLLGVSVIMNLEDG